MLTKSMGVLIMLNSFHPQLQLTYTESLIRNKKKY